jgi:hypothetical protein
MRGLFFMIAGFRLLKKLDRLGARPLLTSSLRSPGARLSAAFLLAKSLLPFPLLKVFYLLRTRLLRRTWDMNLTSGSELLASRFSKDVVHEK